MDNTQLKIKSGSEETSLIHPTAIIDSGAKLGKNIVIGPYSIIGPDVSIGDHVKIHAHTVIDGFTMIGENSEIFPFASIGMRPQDLKFGGEKSELVIGKNTVIREHVTMNPGTSGDQCKTTIGDNCLFMVGSHVAHDCVIGNNVILANNATLAGHVHVGNHVVIGGLAAVHQFVRIGDHAIIGGMSGVESDVIPYGRVKGERAFLAGLNLVGLERRGFTKEQIRTLQRAFNQMFGNEGTMEERIDLVESDFEQDEAVQNIIRFAKAKTRFSLCQPSRKS